MTILFRSCRPNLRHLDQSIAIARRQCRILHLYFATADGLDNHKIKDYVAVDNVFLQGLMESRLRLYTGGKGERVVVEDINLRQVLKEYLKPGACLIPHIRKETNPPSDTIPEYQIAPLKLDTPPPKRLPKMTRDAFEYHFSAVNEKAKHFQILLQEAFNNLKSSGDTQRVARVEFHVHRPAGKNSPKRPQSSNAVREMLEGHLHLHPQVIAKAMPAFSGTIVSPHTNQINDICWVVQTARHKPNGELDYPNKITKKLTQRRERLYERDKRGIGQLTMLEKRAAGWKSRKKPPSEDDHLEEPSGQQGWRTTHPSKVERDFSKEQEEKEQKHTAVGERSIGELSQVVKKYIGSDAVTWKAGNRS